MRLVTMLLTAAVAVAGCAASPAPVASGKLQAAPICRNGYLLGLRLEADGPGSWTIAFQGNPCESDAPDERPKAAAPSV